MQHSSGCSAELQDLVICELLLKYLMMNILIAFHFALYVSIAVIMSEINPNLIIIKAHLFPDEMIL